LQFPSEASLASASVDGDAVPLWKVCRLHFMTGLSTLYPPFRCPFMSFAVPFAVPLEVYKVLCALVVQHAILFS